MYSDRSWMLNPKAIRNAKLCIQIVKDELGIKLALADPSFLNLLEEYVELTGSKHLAEAFIKLAGLAGVPLGQHILSASKIQALPYSENTSLPMREVG